MTTNSLLHNLFFVLSQKLLIVETRLNALSGDITKMISIKQLLYNIAQQLNLIHSI